MSGTFQGLNVNNAPVVASQSALTGTLGLSGGYLAQIGTGRLLPQRGVVTSGASGNVTYSLTTPIPKVINSVATVLNVQVSTEEAAPTGVIATYVSAVDDGTNYTGVKLNASTRAGISILGSLVLLATFNPTVGVKIHVTVSMTN